jgi:arginase family enzyme
MDLDPQVAPSTSTDVPGGLRQRPEEEAEGATDDEDPNIGDDFDDM